MYGNPFEIFALYSQLQTYIQGTFDLYYSEIFYSIRVFRCIPPALEMFQRR